ncbi:MAG: DedA family protein [Firmicutes bacterium]|nr:DedA family protein [Bacillota bacterium]
MHLTEWIAALLTKFIESTGYITVFIGMTMESMIFPVPSEAILPFAGFLIAEGKLTFFLVILFSTLGSFLGSTLSYWLGYHFGKPFIIKFGRFFLLDLEELEATEKYFKKYGQITVLICRFIPVIRHLISIPAGLGKMKYGKFIFFTVVGAGMWNAILTYIGFVLKQHWQTVIQYSREIDLVVIGFLLILTGIYIYRHVRKLQKKKGIPKKV